MMMNIMAMFLSWLAIVGGCILLYIFSSVVGVKSPEMVVFTVLTVALAFEYKNKLLNK